MWPHFWNWSWNRISSYSFRGNYSFLNLWNSKVTVHKCAETIQWRKLFISRNYMRKYGNLLPGVMWFCVDCMPCSWHEKSNSPILEFKRLQKAFEIKKTRLKIFFKVINESWITIKKGFWKALLLLCGTLNSRIGEFDFWCHGQVIGEFVNCEFDQTCELERSENSKTS